MFWDFPQGDDELARSMDLSKDVLDNIEKLLSTGPVQAAQLLRDTKMIEVTTGPLGSMVSVMREVLVAQEKLSGAEREYDHAKLRAELATRTAENMGPLLSLFFKELRRTLGR
jgi:hypothetical protein